MSLMRQIRASSSRIELGLESLQTSYSRHQNYLSTHLGKASADQQAQRLSLEQLIERSFSYIRDELSAHRQETATRLHQLSAHNHQTNVRLNQVSAQGPTNRTPLNRVMNGLTGVDTDLRTVNQVFCLPDNQWSNLML